MTKLLSKIKNEKQREEIIKELKEEVKNEKEG